MGLIYDMEITVGMVPETNLDLLIIWGAAAVVMLVLLYASKLRR